MNIWSFFYSLHGLNNYTFGKCCPVIFRTWYVLTVMILDYLFWTQCMHLTSKHPYTFILLHFIQHPCSWCLQIDMNNVHTLHPILNVFLVVMQVIYTVIFFHRKYVQVINIVLIHSILFSWFISIRVHSSLQVHSNSFQFFQVGSTWIHACMLYRRISWRQGFSILVIVSSNYYNLEWDVLLDEPMLPIFPFFYRKHIHSQKL